MSLLDREEEFLKRLVKCIALQFGDLCEVVLHDLRKDYDHTIIAIENNHITGRNIGDSGTNLGLELLRGTEETGDRFNYITKTNTGKILRSSTIFMLDSSNIPIGSICINYDITNLLSVQKELQKLINMDESTEEITEYFDSNVDDLLDHLIVESFKKIGKSISQMNKEDKLTVLSYLDKKGAFLIKKAGDKISNFYHISKYTLYAYLEEIREKKN